MLKLYGRMHCAESHADLYCLHIQASELYGAVTLASRDGCRAYGTCPAVSESHFTL